MKSYFAQKVIESCEKYAKVSRICGISVILYVKSLLISWEKCNFAGDICKLFNYLRERNYGKKTNHVYGGGWLSVRVWLSLKLQLQVQLFLRKTVSQ